MKYQNEEVNLFTKKKKKIKTLLTDLTYLKLKFLLLNNFV